MTKRGGSGNLEVNSQLPTPNSQLPTPNPQPPTPNLQPPTPKTVSGKLSGGTRVALDMGEPSWIPRKPFDIRERLFDFGLLIIRLSQFLHTRGPIAIALSYQLLKCSTSAGANYEEADDGSSARDSVSKKRISLRELKESRFRLRLLRSTGLLTAEHDPVIQEATN